MLKRIILWLLEHKVKQYMKKHKPLLVVVTGSVGKTSTKQAVATVLNEKYQIRAHSGNHNTHYSVPTALMGVEYPDNPRSIQQWRAVFQAMNARISGEKDVDVIVQELGTDRPGDIKAFGRYLQPDVAIITAVSEEHMENFGSVDDVAKEELAIAKFAKLTIINRDDIEEIYASYADTHSIDTYGVGEKAEYRLIVEPASPLDGRIGRMVMPEWGEITVTLQLIGNHSLKAAAAAACVGAKMGLTSQQIADGVSKLKPVAGRMNVLRGQEGSTIIDDSYNSSPLAVSAALDTLYTVDAPQRIVILGSMNELGTVSAQAHEQIGLKCDPAKLDWVITIGEEAAKYIAPAALKKGCQVKTCHSPYEAGGFAHSVLKRDAVVLVKGSQNGVFSEEAVKVLLHTTEDGEQLVRQSPYWLKKKDDQFDRPVSED